MAVGGSCRERDGLNSADTAEGWPILMERFVVCSPVPGGYDYYDVTDEDADLTVASIHMSVPGALDLAQFVAGLSNSMDSQCAPNEPPTLRDQLAMAALQSVVHAFASTEFVYDAPVIAETAYRFADAMLEARKLK